MECWAYAGLVLPSPVLAVEENSMRRSMAGLAPFLVIASLSFCQEGASTIHHVSGAVPGR
jgi:hypothetical protein